MCWRLWTVREPTSLKSSRCRGKTKGSETVYLFKPQFPLAHWHLGRQIRFDEPFHCLRCQWPRPPVG
jgi:hypothetical protein